MTFGHFLFPVAITGNYVFPCRHFNLLMSPHQFNAFSSVGIYINRDSIGKIVAAVKDMFWGSRSNFHRAKRLIDITIFRPADKH